MVDIAAEAVPLTQVVEQQMLIDPLRTGFMWYVPPMASETSHTTGGQQWCIAGHDMQVLTMTVPSGQTIVTEIGTFMYMHPKMDSEVECQPCNCRRMCGGENCVKLLLKNESTEVGTSIEYCSSRNSGSPKRLLRLLCATSLQRIHCMLYAALN